MRNVCPWCQLAVAIVLLFAGQLPVHADGFLALHSLNEEELHGEQMMKVTNFPGKSSLRSRQGHYVNAGYRYKIFEAFGMPLWTYDGQWCAYVDETHYVDLNRSDLADFANRFDVFLPETPDLPVWYANVATLCFEALVGLAFLIWVYVLASKDRVARGSGPQNQRDVLTEEVKVYAHDWRLHIVACAAKFAKVDGVVTKSELVVMEEVFETLDLTGALRPLAIDTFQFAKKGSVTVDDCVRFYFERYQSELDLLQILMSILFAVARADGEPNAQTREALLGVCQLGGFDYQWWTENDKRRKARAKPTHVGCKSTDTIETIRNCYRKLVKDFHPDTVISKGLPADFIKFAEERFKQIQAAYETVMEARMAGKA